jgi:hypothetical protein
MRYSRKVMEFPRRIRRDMVLQYVGSNWSEEASREPVPVNLLAMYVQIVSRALVAKSPRVMLSTFERPLKPTVDAMQDWANKEIERIDLAGTLQRVVVDALFSIGILKVGLATPGDAAFLNWNIRGGDPFAVRIDLDDFVYDCHARDFSEAAFIGHRFRLPLKVVRDDPIYSKQSRERLTPSRDPRTNESGDERINVLGRGYYGGDSEEVEDLVDLWEVYLPRQRLVLTLADDDVAGGVSESVDGTDQPLRAQRWIGPETGPYHLLGYGIVPGNANFKGPIQDLLDLHLAVNRTVRKAIRTIDRMKENLLFQGASTEDAQRINEANDGEAVRVDNPDRVKNVVFSGTSLANLLTMSQTLNQLFSRQAGNLDIMGGLAPQSGTLGQDRMLDQNSSRTVIDMQERTVGYVSRVLRGLCWYWYNDPFKVMRTAHNVLGVAQIKRTVTPQARQQGRFEDLDIMVDPYSLQHQTPQTRLAALQQVVTSTVMPLMQLMLQQGISFDINAWLVKVGRLLDAPDLQEILTIVEPPDQSTGQAGGGGAGEKPPMPPQTQRTYQRLNVPMRTDRGDALNALNAMRGVNPGGAPQTNGVPTA